MSKRRVRNSLQNLALVLLTLSALFLLARLPLFHINWTDRVQSLLSARPAESGPDQVGGLGGMFPSVHLIITGDSEYSRWGAMYLSDDDPLLQQVFPLFQEALGSAAEAGITAEETLRGALDTPSIYVDLTTQLPLAAVAAWLGEGEAAFERNVRSMSLTTEAEDTATLYLRGGEGEIYRYYTALPVSAVRGICDASAPNSSYFAYDTQYDTLSPYTVLVPVSGPLPDLTTELPAGYSSYNLLTALDFNAHTLSRYTGSDGAEVVEESPRSLRISPDGVVSYSTRGEVNLPLYRVSAAGETPTVPEALSAAWRLAGALTEGVGASPLSLRAVEETGNGYILRFRYQAEGIPVVFSDEADALSVTVSGRAITTFTYRCRRYTAGDTDTPLLPSDMAWAIAALHPGAELSIGYVDGGAEALSAQWLAG